MKLNDPPLGLERIQEGRHKEVPIETNNRLWLFWIKKDDEWDAETITRPGNILEAIKEEDVSLIFCVWHGTYRTNIFLMDKADLIQRFHKMGVKDFK